MELSNNIKILRRKRKLTLRQLADISNLSFGVISHIERGYIKDPKISTVIKLAEAFDISIDELVGNNNRS